MVVVGAGDGLALPMLQRAEGLGLRAGLADPSIEVTRSLARTPVDGLVVRCEKTATVLGVRNLLAATVEAHGPVKACVCFLMPQPERNEDALADVRARASGSGGSGAGLLPGIGRAVAETLVEVTRIADIFADHLRLQALGDAPERSGGNDGGGTSASLTFVVVMPSGSAAADVGWASAERDQAVGERRDEATEVAVRVWGRAVSGALHPLILDLALGLSGLGVRVNALIVPRVDKPGRGTEQQVSRRPRVLAPTVDDIAGLTLATVTGKDAATTGQVIYLKPLGL